MHRDGDDAEVFLVVVGATGGGWSDFRRDVVWALRVGLVDGGLLFWSGAPCDLHRVFYFYGPWHVYSCVSAPLKYVRTT